MHARNCTENREGFRINRLAKRNINVVNAAGVAFIDSWGITSSASAICGIES